MEYRDYYATLGVDKGASQADIKKAFRRLARENHPDVNKGNDAAEKRFKEISEANEVLSDAEKRKAYDQLGANWKAYQQAGADLLFVEAPRSEADMARVPGLLNRPCLANMVEGGKTPFKTVSELKDMGYAIALFPISTLLASAMAVRKVVETILRDGSTQSLSGEIMTFGQFNELIGLEAFFQLMDGAPMPNQGGKR